MIFADIIIDISSEKLDRSFQYRVPEELEKEIKVGMVVSIPFGNGNQLRKGYVTGLTREPKVDPARLKNICGISSAEETTESENPSASSAALIPTLSFHKLPAIPVTRTAARVTDCN